MGGITVRVEVDSRLAQQAIRKLGDQAPAALVKGLMAAGEVIAAAADARLGEAVNAAARDGESVKVGPSADEWHWRFFEFGTRPHVIRPTNKKALLIAGQMMRAKANHPGMAARPFLRPALDESFDAAMNAAATAVREALTE